MYLLPTYINITTIFSKQILLFYLRKINLFLKVCEKCRIEYWWWETWSVYYYYTDITLINNLSWWLFISAWVASSTSVSAEHQSNQSIDICNVLKKCETDQEKKLFVIYDTYRFWCKKIATFMRRWRWVSLNTYSRELWDSFFLRIKPL